MMPTIYFYVSSQLHLLDLSGPLQVFQEAQDLGIDYRLEFISSAPTISSSSGLELSSLMHFSEFTPKENDIVFVPGFDTDLLASLSSENLFFDWLRSVQKNKVTICSVCTGAFLLAKSGILDYQECTTHWKYIDQLKASFPLLKTIKNRLFVKSDNIYTSAGVATGIDLALFLIEERNGESVALKIAKELAVYIRRSGSDEQESVFLQFRDHQDQKVHIVQDWIIHNLEKASSIENLAELAHMSKRNLTRVFKSKTGITIAEYRTKLRVEKAKSLQQNSGYKLEQIAFLCGFKSAKQLRIILDQSNPKNVN